MGATIIISNDPSKDPRAGGLPSGHPDLNAYLGIPIFGSHGMIAMLGVANRNNGYDQALVEELQPMLYAIAGIVESSNSVDLIKDMAEKDQLTRCYNRAYFENKITTIINSHLQHQEKFALILVDLNHFKDINDHLGHYYGDQVLIQFSQRIKQCMSSADIICRIGGDEFIIVLQQLTHYNQAGGFAQRIKEFTRAPYKIEQQNIECSCSIGIACFPIAGNRYKQLIQHADFALYKAKSNNSIEYFSTDLEREFNSQAILKHDLPKAICNNELSLNFQPQVDLNSQRITGFEVLLRWQHPTEGTIPPNVFIPFAENNNLTEAINHYVLKHTLNALQTLSPKAAHPYKIAINVSPSVHGFKQHLADLLHTIEQADIDQSCYIIEFEITESCFIEGSSSSVENLSELIESYQQSNIRFAIDDFGVKYSSINRFLEIHFNTIKIDLSFTQRLDQPNSETARAIIESLIQLANKLGFTVIAEGVETQQQARILTELGCELAQGFYFYKPMPLEGIAELLTRSS